MSLFSKKKKILVVEDEADIAANLKLRLEMESFDVQCAADGKSGVERAQSWKPDLIILDVMLPIANGYEVCSLLRKNEKTQRTPVLMLTALPHVQDAEKAFSVGANDFLNKPYNNERLLKKVRALLETNA